MTVFHVSKIIKLFFFGEKQRVGKALKNLEMPHDQNFTYKNSAPFSQNYPFTLGRKAVEGLDHQIFADLRNKCNLFESKKKSYFLTS